MNYFKNQLHTIKCGFFTAVSFKMGICIWYVDNWLKSDWKVEAKLSNYFENCGGGGDDDDDDRFSLADRFLEVEVILCK